MDFLVSSEIMNQITVTLKITFYCQQFSLKNLASCQIKILRRQIVYMSGKFKQNAF